MSSEPAGDLRAEVSSPPGRAAHPPGWARPVRRFVGVVDDPPARSRLSPARYGLLTVLALGITGAQLLLLPRWLTARHFGLVVIAVSVTQGLLQFGDMGLGRVCLDATRTPEDRRRLRAQAHGLTLLSAVGVIAAAAAVGVAAPSYRQMATVVALGAVAAAAVAGDKYRGVAREVAGDEVAAAGLNFLWANAPKLGLVVGVLVFESAIGLVAASALAGAVLCRPRGGSLRAGRDGLRRARLWVVPCIALASSFILMWADTYFLSARLGVAEAGAYEALYRLLGVCTYLFLPLTSVATSRVSVSEHRPLVRPMLWAVVATALALGASVVFVYTAAPAFFPHLTLPRDAVPGLVVYYLLLPVSYCLGSALYVRARPATVTWAVAAAAAVCLAGHAVFTLRGGPAEAATVAAIAMGVAVLLQGLAYRGLNKSDGFLRSKD